MVHPVRDLRVIPQRDRGVSLSRLRHGHDVFHAPNCHSRHLFDYPVQDKQESER